MCKSLKPLDYKLEPDTWFYAKRCFLAFAESYAKQMLLSVSDTTLKSIMEFLDEVERYGRDVCARVEQHFVGSNDVGNGALMSAKGVRSVAYEARLLRQIFTRLFS